MSFCATKFEFRHRFWIIGGIFWFGFGLYALDHSNVSVAAAHAVVGHGAIADSPLVGSYARAILVVGTGIAVLAGLIRSWAGGYIHSSVVYDANLHSDRLVADGPYRHLRNPLYLGNILLAIGIGAMASRFGFLFLLIGNTLFCYRLILREEATLLESQGESYLAFFKAVPRIWPSLRPRVPAGGRKPNWLDGFAGELFIWSFPLGMAAFDVTLQIRYFWIIMAAGFAVYFVQAFLRRKARAAQT
jgi:protein-S-isoprenylcysteine O-methyltransferase Ste14